MAQVDSENSTVVPAKPSAEAPENPADALYFPTDTTPEELFQAIGRLRKEARDEIDRLIGFLDHTDDYVSRELEIEDGNDEPGGDDEPSLGSFDRMVDQEKSWRTADRNPDVYGWSGGTDNELDDCDYEDSDPAEESDSGIGDHDGLQEQHSGRIFPSGLRIEGVQ
jgi:hypothetical protein